MASNEFDTLFADINESEQLVTSNEDQVIASLRLREGKSRQFLTYIIIIVYSIVVVGTFLVLAYKAICGKPEAVSNIFELLKIGIVPVVTFVVGYYYGTSSK